MADVEPVELDLESSPGAARPRRRPGLPAAAGASVLLTASIVVAVAVVGHTDESTDESATAPSTTSLGVRSPDERSLTAPPATGDAGDADVAAASPDAPDDARGAVSVSDTVRRIDPPGGDDYVGFYGAGYLWIASDWNWDSDGGACITVSRRFQPPMPAALDKPRERTGCVPGSRRDVPMTVAMGDDLIGFTLTDSRSDPWTAQIYRHRLALRTNCAVRLDKLPMEDGSMYEVACGGAPPQLRAMPRSPDDTFIVLPADGDATPLRRLETRFDEWRGDPTGRADGVELYEIAPGALQNEERCLVAVVPALPGWREGCSEGGGRDTFAFAAGDAAFVIHHDGAPEVTMIRDDAQMLAAPQLGCSAPLAEIFRSAGDVRMWSALACRGQDAVGVLAPTVTGPTPSGVGGSEELLWIGLTADGRSWLHAGRPTGRGPWACGRMMCPGREHAIIPLPLTAAIDLRYGAGAEVIDVTQSVREVARDATDPAGIAVALRDHLVTDGSVPRSTDVSRSIDAISHQVAGMEHRAVHLDHWNTGRDTSESYVIWTVRRDGSDTWDVHAAFHIRQ